MSGCSPAYDPAGPCRGRVGLALGLGPNVRLVVVRCFPGGVELGCTSAAAEGVDEGRVAVLALLVPLQRLLVEEHLAAHGALPPIR